MDKHNNLFQDLVETHEELESIEIARQALELQKNADIDEIKNLQQELRTVKLQSMGHEEKILELEKDINLKNLEIEDFS